MWGAGAGGGAAEFMLRCGKRQNCVHRATFALAQFPARPRSLRSTIYNIRKEMKNFAHPRLRNTSAIWRFTCAPASAMKKPAKAHEQRR
jgi:hypothetical protein